MKINKELKLLKHFTPVVYKFLLPLFFIILSVLKKNFKSDKDITIKKYKIKSNNKNIKVYGYFPTKQTKTYMIYFHGGAFFMKGYPFQYNICRKYAIKANINVFFVDYHLAPKHKYPKPVIDGYNTYKFICDTFNVSSDNIGVGGDSAGGSIASCLVNFIKQKEGKDLLFQMLIYPVISDKMTTESMKIYQKAPMWNGKLNKKMWQWYLKDVKYDDPLEHYTNVQSYIEVCEHDCLRDEGLLYYNKLKANNKTILNYTLGTVHGYDILYKKQIVIENINKRIEFLNSINR